MPFKIKPIFLVLTLLISFSFADNIALMKNVNVSDGQIIYNGIKVDKLQIVSNGGIFNVKKVTDIEVVDGVFVIKCSDSVYHLQMSNIDMIWIDSGVMKIVQ